MTGILRYCFMQVIHNVVQKITKKQSKNPITSKEAKSLKKQREINVDKAQTHTSLGSSYFAILTKELKYRSWG